MGLFNGIKDAKINKGGVYLLPGDGGGTARYRLKVKLLRVMKTRKKEDQFISEFTVVESTNAKRPAGTDVSWLANLTKHEAALGNIKGLLAALFNCTEDEVDETGADRAVEEEGEYANPCEGMEVVCEATEITTRAGKPFTKCVWFPVEEAA